MVVVWKWGFLRLGQLGGIEEVSMGVPVVCNVLVSVGWLSVEEAARTGRRYTTEVTLPLCRVPALDINLDQEAGALAQPTTWQ